MEKNWALFLVLVEVDGINWKQMATAKWIFFYLKKKRKNHSDFFRKNNIFQKEFHGQIRCRPIKLLRRTSSALYWVFLYRVYLFFWFFFRYRRVSRRRFSFFFLFAINCDRVLFFLFFLPIFFFFFKSHDLGGPAAYRIFFLPNFFFFCYFSFSSKTSFFLRDAIAGSDLFFPLIQRRKKKVKKK